ncbi:YbbR-like domain-containing protein [Ochrovirga pacifica]|uniref:YbbR-like domain-containing protein n=1 Tax=Ochrovirga pacifica TaxID=1042376 RepID=UPI000255774B|nr:YbbR-like domain-containing protein [Ochrovirga pacifica]
MRITKNQLTEFLNKKKNVVFLIFVVATFVFWFLNRLSKDYTQEIYYNINYKELPNRFIFQETPPKTLSVVIESSGFYLFTSAFKNRTLDISLKNIKKKAAYRYFLLESELYKQAKERLNGKARVLGVSEDSLFVQLGKKGFKKVPVKASIDLTYKAGYKSFSAATLIPDSITVSGPEMLVNNINQLKLQPLIKEGVMETIVQNVAVIKDQNPKINYSHSQVKVKVEVEKITEKTLEIPVKIINPPKGEVVIYPKKIKVSCQMKLSQFHEITTNDFQIVCDYKKRINNYMNASLSRIPDNVSSVKLGTERVEYLILK